MSYLKLSPYKGIIYNPFVFLYVLLFFSSQLFFGLNRLIDH